MKGFVFRYAKLLKLRQRTLDEARSRLLEAQQALDKLDALQQQIQDELQRERQQAAGNVSVTRMLDVSRYLIQVEAQLKTLHQQRQQLQAEMQRRQDAAQVAFREVKQMERLQERQRTAYAEMRQQKEQEALDEFAIMHRGTAASQRQTP